MSSKVGADDFIVGTGATVEQVKALPRVETWPQLAPEALHGLAGRIVEVIRPWTEADPVAVLAHVLAGVGNVIGSGPHARVQHTRHPLRLNIALVGRTAKSRKGLSWSTPRYLLERVDPDWAARRIVSGLSSGEGVIAHVRDAREDVQLIREKGRVVGSERVVVDEGEPDKRLFVIEQELAVVLRRMAAEGNSLSAILREAWDSGDLRTLTKNSPLRATGAHVSIVGHITEEEVRRYLTETERGNGFANRFLWLLVRRSQLLPEGGAVPDHELATLVEELRTVVAFGRTVGEVRRDPEARALWGDEYPQLSAGEPGMVGAITSRAEAQVLRLSALYAVMDRSAIVRPEHLHAALAVWEHAEASARRIFGQRIGYPVADAILEALTARGPLSRTDLHGIFGRHRRAEEIDEAVACLETAGRARRGTRETGGRPSEVWEALPT